MIDGLQAQGDLVVVPLAWLGTVTPSVWPNWRPVPPDGVELVRGGAGNNPHTLVADPGTYELTAGVRDPLDLGIAIVANGPPAHLIHPEHGGSGIAPGRRLVRRQQERGTGPRKLSVLVTD